MSKSTTRQSAVGRLVSPLFCRLFSTLNPLKRFTKGAQENCPPKTLAFHPELAGLVLSGGGSRAAYQVGALRALHERGLIESNPFAVIVGSSMGAVNAVLLAAYLTQGVGTALDVLGKIWRERNQRNTFAGSSSRQFLRTIKLGMLQYLSPGPNPTSFAAFDPTPLRQIIAQAINAQGGLKPESLRYPLRALGLMTTREGTKRTPLLLALQAPGREKQNLQGMSFDISFVPSLSAEHAFASAALPALLPPVVLLSETGQVRLVDGGISDNLPVDPALRLGAEEIVLIDTSGRKWWCERSGKSLDRCYPWEVAAREGTFCLRPSKLLELHNRAALGALLKESVGPSTHAQIRGLGPVWPVFKYLKHRLGEEIAYELMSYVVVNPEYTEKLLTLGYQETIAQVGTL